MKSERLSRKAVVLGAAVAAMFVSGAITPADAALVHRYSFTTDGTATDSVGTANATLINGATVTGGQLVTAGGGSGAGGTAPAANLSGTTAVGGLTGDFSIESYFTRGALATNNFSTLYNFAAGAADTANYLVASPGRGSGENVTSVAFKQAGMNGGAEVTLRGTVLAPGTSHVSTTTYNAATGTAILYVDGLAVARSTLLTGFNLSTKGVKAGIGGNASYPDPAMIGSTTDFRINNDTLSGAQVARNFLAGADSLTADTTTTIATGDLNDGAIFDNGPASATKAVVIAGGTTGIALSATSAGLLTVANNGLLGVSSGSTLTLGTGLDILAGGSVNLNGGVLNLKALYGDGQIASTAAGTRSFNFNGGTLQAGANILTTPANITATINATSAIDSNGNTFNFGSTIVAAGGMLRKIGAGTVVISSPSTSTTEFGLVAGTLEIAPPAARTVALSNAIANKFTFDPTNAGVAAQLTINQANPVDLTGEVLVGAPGVATNYSLVGIGTGGNGNVLGKITGGNTNSTLNITGFFKISGTTNDYVGRTQLNGSTSVSLASGSAFGTSTVVFNDGGLEGQVALTGANRITNNAIIPSTNVTGRAAFFNGANDIEYAGNITSNATETTANEIQKGGAGRLTLSGTVTLAGNMGITSAGGTVAVPKTIRIAGNTSSIGANHYLFIDVGANGDTQFVELANSATVSGLTLFVKGRATIATPTDRVLSGLVLDSVSGNNTYNAGISIRATGGGYGIRSQAGSTLTVNGSISGIVNAATPREFELTGAGNGVIGAIVSNTVAATPTLIGLSMVGETTGSDTTGAGQWSLNSTGNTFSGGISVVDGKFFVNGTTTNTAAIATNVANVYGGTLGGTGALAQAITVFAPNTTTVTLVPGTAGGPNVVAYAAATNNNKGGTLAPGNPTTPIGTLTTGKSATINNTFAVDIDPNANAGAGASDKLAVGTVLDITNAKLVVTNIGSGDADDVYIIATYGSLTGAAFASTILPAGYSVDYNYGGTNNTIALVPEPATLTALAGMAVLGLTRRRRA